MLNTQIWLIIQVLFGKNLIILNKIVCNGAYYIKTKYNYCLMRLKILKNKLDKIRESRNTQRLNLEEKHSDSANRPKGQRKGKEGFRRMFAKKFEESEKKEYVKL